MNAIPETKIFSNNTKDRIVSGGYEKKIINK
jgi:hypothetical protein